MLQLYGRRYVIEHVVCEFNKELERRRYQAYVTDALMAIADNTARYAGGKTMSERWADQFLPKDTRTSDEIAMDVIRNAGLTVKGR